MTYGVTATGFNKPDFLTLFAQVEAELKSRYSNNLKNTGDSVAGNFIGIQAEREAIIWEQLEAVYLSAWIQFSSGESLDNAAALVGVFRVAAEYSTVNLELVNNSISDVTVLAGSQIQQSSTQTIWETTATVIIPANSTIACPARSDTTGYFTAEEGSINTIISLVSGWSEVSNTDEAVTGRDRETDSELRLKAQNRLAVAAGSIGEAIATRIRNEVPGVTFVSVQENDTSSVDENGLLPHSLRFVVAGGTDLAIATMILNTKPGGINTNGEVETTFSDYYGAPKIIRFDRTVNDEIYLIVEIIKNSKYPSNGDLLVKDLLVKYGLTYGDGDKVINHYLKGALNSIPGIDELIIYQGTSPDPNSEENITIPASARANIAISNIVVNSVSA